MKKIMFALVFGFVFTGSAFAESSIIEKIQNSNIVGRKLLVSELNTLVPASELFGAYHGMRTDSIRGEWVYIGKGKFVHADEYFPAPSQLDLLRSVMTSTTVYTYNPVRNPHGTMRD